MFFILLFIPVLVFAMPCGVSVSCSSVSSDYVGLCLGEYNILYAFNDYGYGNVQLQNTGIQCDAVLPPGSFVVIPDSSAVLLSSLVSGFSVLSYVIIASCLLFSFLLGYSGGTK